MFSSKIKIDKAMYERLTKAALRAGYASTDEFVKHVLERVILETFARLLNALSPLIELVWFLNVRLVDVVAPQAYGE